MGCAREKPHENEHEPEPAVHLDLPQMTPHRDCAGESTEDGTSDENADDHRKTAEGADGATRPIDGARVVHEAGEQSEMEAALHRHALRATCPERSRGAAQRDEQRRQRDERNRRVAVLRE